MDGKVVTWELGNNVDVRQ